MKGVLLIACLLLLFANGCTTVDLWCTDGVYTAPCYGAFAVATCVDRNGHEVPPSSLVATLVGQAPYIMTPAYPMELACSVSMENCEGCNYYAPGLPGPLQWELNCHPHPIDPCHFQL